MANNTYALGAEKTFGALIDWENDDIRVVAVSSAYVPDLDTDEWYSDISAYALSTPVALTGKTIDGGVFDADDVNVTLSSGTAKALVIYKYNATPGAAALLAYVDNILGFPVTTAGGVQPVVWPATGIFAFRRR